MLYVDDIDLEWYKQLMYTGVGGRDGIMLLS